jgi:cystathionine beta-synthase/cysteine synthase A
MKALLEHRVGHTPLLRLPDEVAANNPLVKVYAKLEYVNPSGSIKDRLIVWWLRQKNLPPETEIVLASSGNSAASLAMFGCQTYRKIHIFTPATTSPQKLGICKAHGAQIHLCHSDYEQQAADYATAHGHVLFDQYNDLLNVEAYQKTLGPEIYRELPDIDYFVDVASTGGTISGVGKYFREVKPQVKIVLADPIGSVLHEYMQSGSVNPELRASHGVEGAGKHWVPGCFLREYIDSSIAVPAAEAFEMARWLSQQQHIPAGLSSGLIAVACQRLAGQCRVASNIVCVFPDSSVRYVERLGL